VCQACTNALNAAKTTYYKEKISGASNDQLLKMINGLFRVKAVLPLPSHESLPALADTFSGFYHSKIVKLREKLEQSEFSAMDLSTVLQPPTCQTAFLEFAQVSETFVSELIMKAPNLVPRVHWLFGQREVAS